VVAHTRTGRIWEGGGRVALRREIERAAARGLQVKLRIYARYVRKYRAQTAGAGAVDLFEKGGYDAHKVLAALNASGEPDVRSALRDLALQRDETPTAKMGFGVGFGVLRLPGTEKARPPRPASPANILFETVGPLPLSVPLR
jgi:hypothetical protein